jgi:tetratricopeptide (TPR) repeat protein
VKRVWIIFAAVPAFLLSLWAGQGAIAQTPGGPQRHVQSQQELEDYRAANAVKGGSALEQAALAFAQKYPQSELRTYLFSQAMREYQRENNAQGVLAAGDDVLAIDANDPQALVLTATVMADSLAPDDSDRERKINAIKRNISHALQVLSANSAPAGASQGQTALYKSTLESMAYATLGLTRLKTGDYAEAEKDLKAAVERATAHPDPYIWYHLALAQDHRKRYPAALNSVEQALQLASANPELQKLAESEHERLARLTGRGKGPAEGSAQPPQ